MNKSIENVMCEEIAQLLPRAIECTVISYQAFAEEEATNSQKQDAKDFKVHHEACKMALAHIEALLKLSRAVDVSAAKTVNDSRAELYKMIQNAEKEIDGK